MSSILDSVLTFTDGPAPAPQAKRPTEDLPRVREVPQTCSCGRQLKAGYAHCSTCLANLARDQSKSVRPCAKPTAAKQASATGLP